MKWLSNRCAGYRQSITLRASGALPEAERVAVEDHLAECADCREYASDIEIVAAPLANWEKQFGNIEPNLAQQMRWAKAIRAAGEPRPSHLFSPWEVVQILWNELFLPARRIWAGLAAAWVFIVIANLNLSDGQPVTMAKDAKPAADMFLALREQERVLAELVDKAGPQVAEPPKRSTPQPRSEWKFVQSIG